jgi:anaerobic selenocysteine-containing dehydrogenase
MAPATHTVRTYCRICIATCGLVVETDGEQVLSLRGDRDHPISEGYTCPKGRGLAALHTHPDRLDGPLLRLAGDLVERRWDEVLDDLAARIGAVLQDDGPSGIAVFTGAGAYTEAAGYLTARRFVRALGLPGLYSDITIDSPNKPVVAAMVGGWNALVPKIDLDAARFVVFVGCNPIVSHGHQSAMPNPFEQLRRIQARGGEVWVVDPRRTETARIADGHLAPRPGTDHAVVAHAVRELLRGGADEDYLRDHAVERDELAAAVAPFTAAHAAELTGLREDELAEFVGAIRRAGRIAFETGTGVSMSSGANVTEWLMWALAVVTGSMERPGGMWFNPGYLGRFDLREIKHVPPDPTPDPGPASRPELPTWFGEHPSVALVDEIEQGNVKVLLDLGGNLVTCLPDTERVVAALAKLDVLVVTEIAHTPTTALATHVLACRDQLERADLPVVFDRSMPRMYTQYAPAVVQAKGERRQMWWILGQLAKRMDLAVLPPGIDPDTATDDDLLRTIMGKCDSTFDELVAAGAPVLGPPPELGWAREGIVRPEGYRLAPQVLVAQLAAMRPPAPLAMINRRQPRVFNGQVKAARHPDRFELLVSPHDAAEAGLADGDIAVVRSANGELTGPVRVDEGTPAGVVAIPHGWSEHNVNALISGRVDVDPLAGMALMSGTAITLERAAPRG